MASTVYDVEEIMLQSGDKVKLRPLSIFDLREFMKVMGSTAESTTEEDTIGVLNDE